jgi:hypothetical protein
MSTELSINQINPLAKANDPGVFNPTVFQQLVAISAQMAHTSLVPETLTKDKSGPFPIEKIQANCFLVAEQAHRWGMSPFAVAQAASVVYGRLMWEGKLVAAVIEQNAGIRLSYEYSGQGENRTVVVSGKFPDEDKPRTVEGSVANWKTDQWKKHDYDQRLAYRGAREWARRHCPGVMLGVVTADEAEDFVMRDATPRVTVSEAEITPSFAKIDAPAANAAPNQPNERVSEEKPVTVPAATEKPAERPVAVVVSSERDADEWIVKLQGSERQLVTIADTPAIGIRANQLTGFQCYVAVKKRGSDFVLTSIELKEEGGDLL